MSANRVSTFGWLLWQACCVAVIWRAGYAALGLGVCIAVAGIFGQWRLHRLWQFSLAATAAALILWLPTETWKTSPLAEAEGFLPWLPPIGITALIWQILVWAGASRDEPLPRWSLGLGIVTLYCLFYGTSSIGQRTELGLGAIVSIMLFAVQCRGATSVPSSDAGVRRPIQRRVAIVLLAAALMTWPVSEQLAAQIQRVQGWVANAVQLNVTHVPSTRAYVRVASLRSVLNEQTHNPTQVALRVFSERAPGYLRGRVYDRYMSGSWVTWERTRGPRWNRLEDKQILSPIDQPPAGIPPVAEPQRLFALQPLSDGPWLRMEIWNDPLRGEMFFLPLRASYVAGEGEFLAIDANDVVHTGISVRRPYVAYAPQFPTRVRLNVRDRLRWLHVPETIPNDVHELAEELARDHPLARDKMMAVTDFFQQNFRYSMGGVVVPQTEDPIVYFLRNRPPAHCEFFASAAATLLRLMGVPTRYVTGYTVREASEYGDYWLARNHNAHAWVEAYDDRTQRWRVVEATPGMQSSNSSAQQLIIDSQSGDDQGRLQRVLELGRYWLEPRWRQVWLEAIGRRLRIPVGVLFAVGIAVVAVRRTRFGLRHQRTDGQQPLHGTHLKQLRRWDRRLRRHGLVRHRAETLHQFAARVQSAASKQDWFADAARWYLAYAETRYRA